MSNKKLDDGTRFIVKLLFDGTLKELILTQGHQP
jgi:hypothetical protein